MKTIGHVTIRNFFLETPMSWTRNFRSFLAAATLLLSAATQAATPPLKGLTFREGVAILSLLTQSADLVHDPVGFSVLSTRTDAAGAHTVISYSGHELVTSFYSATIGGPSRALTLSIAGIPMGAGDILMFHSDAPFSVAINTYEKLSGGISYGLGNGMAAAILATTALTGWSLSAASGTDLFVSVSKPYTIDALGVEFDHSVSVAPIPEPSTYAMMALGLGLVGWMASRRRQTA